MNLWDIWDIAKDVVLALASVAVAIVTVHKELRESKSGKRIRSSRRPQLDLLAGGDPLTVPWKRGIRP